MKITTIRISDELYIVLDEYARKKELSKNQVVKQALKKMLLTEVS